MEEFCELFPPPFIAAANKDLFEWNCRLCVYNLSHFWLLKAPLEKNIIAGVAWLRAHSSARLAFHFPTGGQDKAHIFAAVPAIMVKRSGPGFYLAQMPWGAERCHCSPPGSRGTGGTKGGRGYLQLLAIDFLYRSPNGLFWRGAAENRQIPAARRELTARLISCEIFTGGSYSRVCFPSANEAAGNEKMKWKNSFLREGVGNWTSAQPSLEPGLCPGHLEITLVSVKASLWLLAVPGLGRNVCAKWFFLPLLPQQVAYWQSKYGDFTLIHNT